MNDGQRIYPVDKFILHHSTGPRFADTDDLTIQDWYSNTGKARAYQNGAINPMHEHPGRPGELTYAQAQYAGVPDSSNKYNYRIVELIARPIHNVAWHAGNWEVNQTSIGIENCGDFSDMLLDDKQLMCIADFYRPIDQELNGATVVWGHKEVSGASTACPARILEERDKLVDMINNPDKWNNILWPQPKITTTTEVVNTPIQFATKTVEDATTSETTVKPGVLGNKQTTYVVTFSDDKEILREVKGESITPAVDEITTVGTYVEPVVTPPVEETPVEEPETGSNPVKGTKILAILMAIAEWLDKLIIKLKGIR